MKIIVILICIISLTAVKCSGQNKAYPSLILDDKYNQIQKEDSKVIPQKYSLKSLQGFILDCYIYDFTLIKTMNNNRLHGTRNLDFI